MFYAQEGVAWFPPNLSEEFYVLKGVLGLVGTSLLLFHMARTWNYTAGLGQRLRYFTLFYVSVLITVASVEQAQQGAIVNYRNLGALGFTVLLIVTSAVSLREYLRDRR